MYRIGLEFRKPLFTAMYDWKEGGAEIAAPQNLQHRWHLNVLDYCFGQAEVPTNSPEPKRAIDPGPEKAANAAGLAHPELWEASSSRCGSVEVEELGAVILTGDNGYGAAWPAVISVAKREGPADGNSDGMAVVTRPAEPRDVQSHSNRAQVAKQLRANTVARLINELGVLKRHMCAEREYARLSGSHPDFLTFRIAELRPDLKQKVVEVRSSTKPVRLAQELAAAHYGKAVATIRDDWKRCKPAEFKLARRRPMNPA